MKIFAHTDDEEFELSVTSERDRIRIRVGDREVNVALDDQRSAIQTAQIGDRHVEFGWLRKDGVYRILIDGIEYDIVLRDPKSERLSKVSGTPSASGATEIQAPIPGLIKKVLLGEGDPVRRDQPVLYLDAMKLENEIASPRDGVLKSIAVQAGQAVEKGQVLFVVG